jgi:hypothetical protein
MANLSTVLAPLYRPLQVRWNWGADQRKAFYQAKEFLKSPMVLAHYDPES